VRRSVHCTALFSVCSLRRAKFPIIYPDLRLDYKVATHPQKRLLFIFRSLIKRDHFILWTLVYPFFWRPRVRLPLVYFSLKGCAFLYLLIHNFRYSSYSGGVDGGVICFRVYLEQLALALKLTPQRLKSVRIIASAFFLEGCVPKSADRGTQTFDGLVPNPEGFGQSMFQNFSLGFECFLGRWWDRDVA
jgi:hypothetical protein